MVNLPFRLLLIFLVSLSGSLLGQGWLEPKKEDIRDNLENMPVAIALIEMNQNSNNPPKVLPPPGKKVATILKFAEGTSENIDMKLNKKFFRSDDPVPYITSLVAANIFVMPEHQDGRGTTFYLRSRGCLTEKKNFPSVKFGDIRNDMSRFLRTMRTLMGYDGIVVEHSGNNFIIGLIDGADLKTGVQGSAILDSASEIVLKKSDTQAQSLFSIVETQENFALAKALVGTKLPKIGTKVVFQR